MLKKRSAATLINTIPGRSATNYIIPSTAQSQQSSPVPQPTRVVDDSPVLPTLLSFCQLLHSSTTTHQTSKLIRRPKPTPPVASDVNSSETSVINRATDVSTFVPALANKLTVRQQPTPRASTDTNAIQLSDQSIYRAIDAVFTCFTRADVRQPSGQGSLNVGEIAPIGVTSMLARLKLVDADVFGDIGSGTGSVLAQVALQSLAQKCIGLEIRSTLAAKSGVVMTEWSELFPRLSRVTVLTGDIRDEIMSTSELAKCTAILCNNLVFEPSANLGVQGFLCSSALVHSVILTERFCTRCHPTCKKEFCILWMLSETIPVPTCWAKKIDLFVYRRRRPQRTELLDLIETMSD